MTSVGASQVLSALENAFLNWQFDGWTSQMLYETEWLKLLIKCLAEYRVKQQLFCMTQFLYPPRRKFLSTLYGITRRYGIIEVKIVQNPTLNNRFALLWKAQIIVLCNQCSCFFRMIPVQLQNRSECLGKKVMWTEKQIFFFQVLLVQSSKYLSSNFTEMKPNKLKVTELRTGTSAVRMVFILYCNVFLGRKKKKKALEKWCEMETLHSVLVQYVSNITIFVPKLF